MKEGRKWWLWIVTAITLLSSSVFASTITLSWTKSLGGKNTQTVNGSYNPSKWEIDSKIFNKI